ncbi:AIR synthase-related protein, partial [Ornithobacterium rhinotracheale]
TINGIAHITGGGLIENVPRILPKGLGVEIQKSSIKVPAIMQELQKRANIAEDEMFGTFNMGVGMVLAVSPDQAEAVIKSLKSLGEEAYEIGKVV